MLAGARAARPVLAVPPAERWRRVVGPGRGGGDDDHGGGGGGYNLGGAHEEAAGAGGSCQIAYLVGNVPRIVIQNKNKKIWNKYLTNKHIKYVSEEVWKLYPLLNDTTKIARVATNNP